MNYARNEGTHRFNKVSSFAEMLGGITIINDNNARTYERLLKQVEKSQ
jgi:hypothetical protein